MKLAINSRPESNFQAAPLGRLVVLRGFPGFRPAPPVSKPWAKFIPSLREGFTTPQPTSSLPPTIFFIPHLSRCGLPRVSPGCAGLQTLGKIHILPPRGFTTLEGLRHSNRLRPYETSSLHPQYSSSPYVSRIVFDAVFLQNRQKLRLKIAAAMVLFLSRNVADCRLDLRVADGECAVALLPSKCGMEQASCIHSDEPRLISRMAADTVRVAGMAMSRCA